MVNTWKKECETIQSKEKYTGSGLNLFLKKTPRNPKNSTFCIGPDRGGQDSSPKIHPFLHMRVHLGIHFDFTAVFVLADPLFFTY